MHLRGFVHGRIRRPTLFLPAYLPRYLPTSRLSIWLDLVLFSPHALVAISSYCHSTSPSELSVSSDRYLLYLERCDNAPACRTGIVGLPSLGYRMYAALQSIDSVE